MWLLGDLQKNDRACRNFDYSGQSFSHWLAWFLVAWHERDPLNASWHTATPYNSDCWGSQWKVFKIQSMYAAPFIPTFLTEIHPSLCFSLPSRCLWWRQPVDNPGQQTAETYRPPRTKGYLTFRSAFPVSSPSYLLLVGLFLTFPVSHLSPVSVSTIWALHHFLKLTWDYGKWI